MKTGWNGSVRLGVNFAVDTVAGVLMRRQQPMDLTIDQLYREHRARLVGLATAITFDRAQAEEVVQDAFVGLHRNIARAREPLGYLHRSVVNRSISVVRRRRTARAHVPAASPPASTPEIDETWGAIMRLPARQRAVVVLRYYEDYTVDDIARTLGWPAGSVKSTLHRARALLKKELS